MAGSLVPNRRDTDLDLNNDVFVYLGQGRIHREAIGVLLKSVFG